MAARRRGSVFWRARRLGRWACCNVACGVLPLPPPRIALTRTNWTMAFVLQYAGAGKKNATHVLQDAFSSACSTQCR
jgi:hypothetical protein